MTRIMTPDEEYDFYKRPENQIPLGEPVVRMRRLTELFPVRFDARELAAISERAAADGRTASAWIRGACARELARV